jgi:hypothetical protein
MAGRGGRLSLDGLITHHECPQHAEQAYRHGLRRRRLPEDGPRLETPAMSTTCATGAARRCSSIQHERCAPRPRSSRDPVHTGAGHQSRPRSSPSTARAASARASRSPT